MDTTRINELVGQTVMRLIDIDTYEGRVTLIDVDDAVREVTEDETEREEITRRVVNFIRVE